MTAGRIWREFQRGRSAEQYSTKRGHQLEGKQENRFGCSAMRLQRSLAVLILVSGLVAVPELLSNGWLGQRQAIAQLIRSDDAWKTVYQELPDFPKENQYTNKETRKVADDDTLVSRLIRYHLYVKGRVPFYRLDWKLTLAEYLGVSGRLDENNYPSANKLNKNPLEGDLAAIQNLNLSQRNALVQALVNAFASQSPRSRPASPN